MNLSKITSLKCYLVSLFSTTGNLTDFFLPTCALKPLKF